MQADQQRNGSHPSADHETEARSFAMQLPTDPNLPTKKVLPATATGSPSRRHHSPDTQPMPQPIDRNTGLLRAMPLNQMRKPEARSKHITQAPASPSPHQPRLPTRAEVVDLTISSPATRAPTDFREGAKATVSKSWISTYQGLIPCVSSFNACLMMVVSNEFLKSKRGLGMSSRKLMTPP